jgi:formylmethanofuran dehydrogenase subunit E
MLICYFFKYTEIGLKMTKHEEQKKILIELKCDYCHETFKSNVEFKQDEPKICPSCYF